MRNILNNKKVLPYLLIMPALMWLAIVIFYPIFEGTKLSFYDIKGSIIGEKYNFIGLENYIRLVKDPYFWKSFRITLIYTFGMTAGSLFIGFATALMLNVKFRFRALARGLTILPWAMPYIAAILVWRWILDYNFGILNYLLKVLHISSESIGWFLDPKYALFTVIIIGIWKEFPLATVVYLAGLQSINPEHYDAAMIDGCNYFGKIRYIVLPGIRAVNKIILLLILVWSFKRVTVIYVLTQGGPARATETLVIKTFNEAFSFFHMGYASAIGTTMLFITLIFSIVYMVVTARGEG